MIFHTKISAAMRDEHVELFKGAFVKQQIDPLARGQLASAVLRVYPRLATAHTRIFTTLLQLFENVFHDAPLL